MHRGIKSIESSFVWIHRLIDSFIPITILWFISILHSVPWHDRYITMGVLGGLVFIIFAQATGTYSNWRGRQIYLSIKLILNAWFLTWMSLIVIAFWFKDSSNFSRVIVTTWAISTPIIFILYRITIRTVLSVIRNEKNTRKIAIIGAGRVGQHFGSIINRNKWLGYNLVAYFDDNPSLQKSTLNNTPVIGTLNDIISSASNKGFDEVYICLPLRAEPRIKELLNKLTDTTLIVKFIPDLFTFDLMHARWMEISGIPIISVYDTPLDRRTARIIKRSEDLILSTIILILISPIMFAISIGVKLTSPGPIFYKQSRVGWNGNSFNMLKFRSMPLNNENNGVVWGNAANKTNTKFGAFIRKYSLDELPQFINVLKGDMSIVGPRPERDVFVEKFRKEIPRYMQKHMVKAGITGWAQINGWRGDTSLSKRIEFDLDYINRWNIWLDIRIIISTIVSGFSSGS